MCYSCYLEDGAPSIITEATRNAAAAIERLYEVHPVGGFLHIVVDDDNTDDDDVDFCLAAMDSGDVDRPPSQIEREVGVMLRAMTKDERISALAIHRGYLTP